MPQGNHLSGVGYIAWAAENISNAEVKEQCQKAIAYLNEVYPWSLTSSNQRR
jgi:hypothetical protein